MQPRDVRAGSTYGLYNLNDHVLRKTRTGSEIHLHSDRLNAWGVTRLYDVSSE